MTKLKDGSYSEVVEVKVGTKTVWTWWEFSADLARYAGDFAKVATHVAAGEMELEEVANYYEQRAESFKRKAASLRNGDIIIKEEIKKDESDKS